MKNNKHQVKKINKVQIKRKKKKKKNNNNKK